MKFEVGEQVLVVRHIALGETMLSTEFITGTITKAEMSRSKDLGPLAMVVMDGTAVKQEIMYLYQYEMFPLAVISRLMRI